MMCVMQTVFLYCKMNYKLTYELETNCPSGCGFNYCNEVRKSHYTKNKIIKASTEEDAKQILMSEKHIYAGTERNIRIINVEIIE